MIGAQSATVVTMTAVEEFISKAEWHVERHRGREREKEREGWGEGGREGRKKMLIVNKPLRSS